MPSHATIEVRREPMPAIQEGDVAPDFTAITHTGEEIKLSQFRGKKAVVLYFYPKDGTTMCTRQACQFRDSYEQFAEAGAVVIGVSADDLERHRSFAVSHNLPFLLVGDRDGSLRKAFGVPKKFGFLPGRVTYVIDKAGVVRLIFESALSAGQHVSEALQVVKSLQRSN